MSYYEHYQVEIRYKDGTIDNKYYIKNLEDDIIIEYNDKLEKEDGLYLNTIYGQELTLDIINIDEIYINEIEEGYTEDRYMFWMNLNDM
jgi:hypothetical protein